MTEFGEGKYFLYRHIRNDNNQVFYIGYGTAKPFNTQVGRYERAYSLRGRNRYWKFISAKTSFRVEILFETENHDEIVEKEIEMIKLYGRSRYEGGTLTNLTIGGDGLAYGTPVNRGTVSKFRKKVHMYDLKGYFIKEFPSMRSCAEYLNIKACRITRAISKSQAFSGHVFYHLYQGIKIAPRNHHDMSKVFKPVIQLSMAGDEIGYFIHALEVESKLKISSASISQVCNNKIRKSAGGFKWRFA